MANRYTKKHSISLIIRKMQIKTTKRDLPLTYQNGCHQKDKILLTEYGEKGSLVHCWSGYKLVQPLQKTVGRFLKKLKIGLLYDPLLRFTEIILKSSLHLHVCSIIYNCQNLSG